MASQNDHLRAQVAALRKGPASRWRRFRLHEVVCGQCGESLVEVMDTEPYAVVLTRRTIPSTVEASLAPDASGAERMAASGRRLRRGDSSFYPISKPPPPPGSADGSQRVRSVCRCRQVTLRLDSIFESLRRGEPKRVLPAASVTD